MVFPHDDALEWNHGLGEIVTALLGAGVELTGLAEPRQRALVGPARKDEAPHDGRPAWAWHTAI